MQYVYLDGDGVGSKLHAHLINANMEGAAGLSESVTRVLGKIASVLRATGARIVFVGGDNIFALADVDQALLESAIALFMAETGVTASVGVGETASDALLALTVAKSLGGSRVIWRRGSTPSGPKCR